MKTCPVCTNEFGDSERTCPVHGVILLERRELSPGVIFRGTYRIVRVLGRGGMGVVYLAEHLLLGEMRALKFLAPELAANPGAVQRFLREAQKAARIGLNQPHIVKTLDVGQDEDGSLFICMEYVDGPSLEALMDNARQGLNVERAFTIARGVALGLAAAHAKGMVHRDIKPANILLGQNDEDEEIAKVADFGIVSGAENEMRLTRTGVQALTPEYASPEQWRGLIPGHELDGRTDLYALGCVLYEMLTGRLPFGGVRTEELREQHIHILPMPPSSLRPELRAYPALDSLVLRMMSKDRDGRPGSAAIFLRELDETRRAQRVEIAPSSPRVQHSWAAPDEAATAVRTPGSITPMGAGGSQEAQVRQGASESTQTGQLAGNVTGTSTPGLRVTPSPGDGYRSSSSSPSVPASSTQSSSRADAPAFGAAGQQNGFAETKRRFTAGTLVGLALLGVAVVGAGIWIGLAHRAQPPGQTQEAQFNPSSIPDNTQPKPDQKPSNTQPGQEADHNKGGGGVPQQKPSPAPAQPTPRPPDSIAPAVPARAERESMALYREGKYLQAEPLFNKECDDGIAASCFQLGWMYDNNLGVSQDYSHAASLYNIACDRSHGLACTSLGELYQTGLGVRMDPTMARSLFNKGCTLGDQWGCKMLSGN